MLQYGWAELVNICFTFPGGAGETFRPYLVHNRDFTFPNQCKLMWEDIVKLDMLHPEVGHHIIGSDMERG